MLLDETAIVATHRGLLRNGNLGDAYRSGIFACCLLVENVVRSPDIDSKEAGVVADLAARTVTSSGAAALLILAGYWVPAAHQIRDIVECTQLMEFFRLQPAKAVEWRDAKGSERNRRFGFAAIEKQLINLRGPRPDIRQVFNFWSNIGSHPSVEGLAQHMTAAGKFLGPTANPDRFKALTGDLWAAMTRATLEFVTTMDSLLPHHPKIEQRFRFDLAAVNGFQAFLGDLTVDDIGTGWK